MDTADLREFYKKRKNDVDLTLSDVSRKINVISNVRLAVAIAFVVMIYAGFKQQEWFYTLIPLAIVFVLLVRRHAVLFSEKTHLQHLSDIQREEIAALDGDTSHNNPGTNFVDVLHAYTHDLDIFGEGSLFQYMNRCHTHDGRALMAERLSSKPHDIERITTWQESVRELAPMNDFRQTLQSLSRQIPDESGDRQQLESWLRQSPVIFGKPLYKFALNVLPTVTIALVVAAFIFEGVTGAAIIAAGLQWVFLSFHLKHVNAFHAYVSGKKNTLARYGNILHQVSGQSFQAPLLQSMQQTATQGHRAVTHLASLVNALDARMNIMTNLVVNSLLLYDLQCVYRLEAWKERHGAALLQWLNVVHEIEVLASLGTFAFNHPRFSFPEVTSDRAFVATGLGHPLIPENERILNDLHMDEVSSVLIITGANMAGKSTFLRAIGVNTVLALTGAPVCAASFRCPHLDIRSGMRTADSLQDHQSYFYAELNRLKSIIDLLRSGTPLLILLDEILKGTNSNDKQAGSMAFVKQLVDLPCLALIATHDLSLGSLEDTYPGKVLNYSFEPRIENDELHFDYKLKRGVARKMNATFLMRKMGILPE